MGVGIDGERGSDGAIIDRLRAEIQERYGNEGFQSLARVLQAMDTNKDGRVTQGELRRGLRDMGLRLTPQESARVIMALFDRGNGCANSRVASRGGSR
ncbi:unnamed protein product, partial [Discosporangium mesarthrocarpum]